MSDHIELTLQRLREGDFGKLLGLTDGIFPPGRESVAAALSIFAHDNSQLRELQAMRLSTEKVCQTCIEFETLLKETSAWTADAIEHAASSMKADEVINIPRFLKITIMSPSNPMPLFAIMEILGREETLRRISSTSGAYYLANLIG